VKNYTGKSPLVGWIQIAIEPVLIPATTAEIILVGVLFLLCLLFIVSALPMAVLAWKGRR